MDPPYIPIDIIRVILEKIPWKERVRLSLVCKSWQLAVHEIHNTKEVLPWLMYFDWNKQPEGGTCKLCDPSFQTTYVVKEPTEERELFVVVDIRDSRSGWVLFSKLIYEDIPIPFVYEKYFLYSPFANRIIKFPILETNRSGNARFSFNSTSPDCLVILFSMPLDRKLSIKTCHPGDKSWKTFEVSGVNGYLLDQVYACEFCYCLFSDGNLGAFDVKQQEWKRFSQRLPMGAALEFAYVALSVASNGDLITATSSWSGDGGWCLWRFDISEKKWLLAGAEIMEKQVMFLGSSRYSATGTSAFSVPALGNARPSAGKIVYINSNNRYNDHYNFFNWYHSFFCPTKSSNLSKDYGWMEEVDKIERIWIQPPSQKRF